MLVKCMCAWWRPVGQNIAKCTRQLTKFEFLNLNVKIACEHQVSVQHAPECYNQLCMYMYITAYLYSPVEFWYGFTEICHW